MIATGKMAEFKVVGCSPIERGSSPLLIKLRGVNTLDCKSKEVDYRLPGLSPASVAGQAGER